VTSVADHEIPKGIVGVVYGQAAMNHRAVADACAVSTKDFRRDVTLGYGQQSANCGKTTLVQHGG
jgi:hypothetical protein